MRLRTVIIAACRWLREKLDSVERRAQLRDGAQREAEMPYGLALGYDHAANGQMSSGLQGHVADAAQQALSRDELEKYYRGMAGSQKSQLTLQGDVYRGGQVINHSIPPYENQQSSLTLQQPEGKRARAAA